MSSTGRARSRGGRRPPPGKLLLDDLWLNEAQAFLDGIARAAGRAFGQKPSLEDFRRLVLTVLGAGDLERWFSNGVGLRVEDIVLKTSKRAAKATPGKIRPGDALAIPIGKRNYAFARVLHDERDVGILLEAFRATVTEPVFSKEVANSGRLFRPRFVNDYGILDGGRWLVVASDPTYKVSDPDKRLEFSYPGPRSTWVARTPLDPRRRPRPISKEEFAEMACGAAEMPDEFEDAVREELAAKKTTPTPGVRKKQSPPRGHFR